MQITITGTPGSGKTTLGKALAKKFKLKFYSTGEIRRGIAKLFELNIDELNKLGEKHPFTDKCIDEIIKKMLKDNFVLDGRLGWWLFPKSVKILTLCNLDIAAERIFKAKRSSEKKYKNIDEVKREIMQRMASDEKRYKKYYKLKNIYDIKNYDIIIDTSYLSAKDMIKICSECIRKLKR
ncbi:MAG: cytidylate kinase family protein [Candidatus Omnitrophica bacterium]|nr:cytidylate kinase family protein [Candidatus Omnitrophota bacterium]